jgi:putative ABC transport system permease protein
VTGRAFELSDNELSMPVAVVNVELARRYWGDERSALDRRVRLEGEEQWRTIVGVTSNVLRADIRGSNPEVYVPARQDPRASMVVMVRASDPDRLIAAARGEVRALDAELPVREIRTVEEVFDDEMSSSRILMGMFVAFAALALLLAASGLYAVVSYSVTQRHQEIGIRMALGAAPGGVVGMVLGRVALLVGLGAALGAAASLWASTYVEALLFGLQPRDPWTLLGATIVLAAIGALAGWIPARRASRIDPAQVLREG